MGACFLDGSSYCPRKKEGTALGSRGNSQKASGLSCRMQGLFSGACFSCRKLVERILLRMEEILYHAIPYVLQAYIPNASMPQLLLYFRGVLSSTRFPPATVFRKFKVGHLSWSMLLFCVPLR